MTASSLQMLELRCVPESGRAWGGDGAGPLVEPRLPIIRSPLTSCAERPKNGFDVSARAVSRVDRHRLFRPIGGSTGQLSCAKSLVLLLNRALGFGIIARCAVRWAA